MGRAGRGPADGALCGLPRAHTPSRPQAWGLGGPGPAEGLGLGPRGRGLPAGAEGVNRSTHGGGRKRSPRRAYSLAHTPSALISASLPGRACQGRSPNRSPAGPAGGTAAAPCSPLPGQPRGPSEQAGTPREAGGDTQAGLFRSGGQLPPSLTPSLRSWAGPSTSAQAQARQAVPVRTAKEAESSQLSSSSSLLMRWKSPLGDPLGHLGDPREKK